LAHRVRSRVAAEYGRLWRMASAARLEPLLSPQAEE